MHAHAGMEDKASWSSHAAGTAAIMRLGNKQCTAAMHAYQDHLWTPTLLST